MFLFNNLEILGQKYRYTTYQGEKIPFTKVNQTIQDTRKYMWLATDQGLFRFDGSQFEDYNTSLRSRYIKTIIPWKKDTLLFANDTGVFKLFYEDNTPKIVPHIIISDTKSGMSYPEELFTDSKGRLWIGQLNGEVYQQDETKVKKVPFSLALNQRISNIFFSEDRFRTVWVLIPKEGLYYFDESSNAFVELEGYSDMSHFYVDGNQILMVGDLRILAMTVDDNHKMIDQKQIDNIGLDFYYINKDMAGAYFLASEQGMYTLTSDQAKVIEIFGSNDPHRVEKLPYNSIHHMYFSEDQIRPGGKIWISTSNGLGLLWSSYFQSVSGMSHDNVFSLSTGIHNEILISQSNVTSVKNLNAQVKFDQIRDVNQVTSISSGTENIWYGTAAGTIILHKNSTKRIRYNLRNRGGGIFYMFTDHKGDNWFCQAPTDRPLIGVAKINEDGRVTIYDEANGLNNRILVVKAGGKSALYAAGIGSETYLYKYNRSRDAFENQSVPFPFRVSNNFEVHDIAIDNNEVVWMATTDGLIKYEAEKVERIDLGAYTENEIRSICVIPGGNLWLATDTNGLVYLDNQGRYAFFDEKSGTPSKVASYRSMIIDHNNQLWVGTAEGAVYSSKSNPKPLRIDAPILNEVKINHEIKNVEKSALRYTETASVTLKFISITFPADDIQYQYKIIENDADIDKNDQMPGYLTADENKITVPELKNGTYSLLVRAQKQGGYSWSDPLEIKLKVQKKWYKTFFGILLFVILGMSIVWYTLRLWVFKKTKNIKASLGLKEEQLLEKEKAFIAQTQDLKNSSTKLQLLHDVFKKIPKGATWDKALPVLSKIVEFPGIDAFEFAFKKGEEMMYRGISQERTNYMDRSEEFNKKESLATYVLIENTPLIITNFNEEIDQYINKRKSEEYLSMILVPFEQKTSIEIVLCIYGKEKNRFTQRDVTLIQILTTFLSISILDELK
ncbi:hypothetical protein GCM10022259_05130 [Aquimarina mytili]